jgi:hypothetical protein
VAPVSPAELEAAHTHAHHDQVEAKAEDAQAVIR